MFELPGRTIADEAYEVCTWCRVMAGAVEDFKRKLPPEDARTSEDHEAIHTVRQALTRLPRDL